ncbi:hypothetical protein BD626DRAFT_486234 [Schizophyllum amplum]|uniref:Transcription initiation factor TFIID subunit 1 histone acetyltransferase domain-containing protein n=1 Tax=Schizophyllum amplum TaxID=97359 RepID=A0A550CMC9_9AGAR|nr:hypothetical protein BD626DRAFT_486234 [Auriculariopsis ampla]
MSGGDENDAVQLGLSTSNAFSSDQIYNDVYEDDYGPFEDDDEEPEPVQQAPKPAPQPKQKRVRVVKRIVERPKTVYERFPTFEKNKVLDFTELFRGETVRKSRISRRPFHVEMTYPRKREAPKGYLDLVVGDTKRQVESKRVEEVVSAGSIESDLRHALEERDGTESAVNLPLHDRTFDLVLLSNWEDQIVYGPEGGSAAKSSKAFEIQADTSLNERLNDKPFRDFTQLEFNHEDDVVPESGKATRPRKRFRLDPSQVRDKFNIANDQYYEVSKERHRVRQTFGQIQVEHAYPAQKLQLPFYKTRLSKAEARSFHRPALQFPSNIELHFTKVRTAKKKKDRAGRKLGKGGNVSEGLHRTTDLSLRDTSNFVLWEYSEEHPPVVPNFGMGSALVNYYRKKDDKDEHVPKFDLGVPFVLEPQDDSPFMKFGNVYPGQAIPALYNNLVRAPLFRHKPYATDFLVVRHTYKGETRYYLREIKNLFVAGQTYPVTEVPGPHSRKITSTIKNRLQIIAFKLLRKSIEERLKIHRLMKYFPDQNELQMRQRLKEFMEYHRRGIHQGFWRLKDHLTIPSDAEMLKMISPEQVVLMESMQVGQRHLADCGYTQTAEDADDTSNLSIEQQLAPWITTKNFILATQAKAMLKLHGEGDPSGRGRLQLPGENYEEKLAEAESRPKSAHRYNVAEQQQIYKSEVERIWKAQFDSLSRKDAPPLTEEDEREYARKARDAAAQHRPDGSIRESPMPMEDREASMARTQLVDGVWKTEIVRDPAVIRAYIRSRQVLEEESTLADSLAPTGDAEKDKRAMKRLEEEIARMKKNQERRLHRKNAKIVKEGGTPMQLNRPIKPDTTRRCGHCGQIGHMKTNRKCPRWAEFNSATPPMPVPTPANTAAGPSGGATSPPPPGAPMGFNRGPAFGFPAAVPSPLATSPPVSAMDVDDDMGGSSSQGPKLKLTLKRS